MKLRLLLHLKIFQYSSIKLWIHFEESLLSFGALYKPDHQPRAAYARVSQRDYIKCSKFANICLLQSELNFYQNTPLVFCHRQYRSRCSAHLYIHIYVVLHFCAMHWSLSNIVFVDQPLTFLYFHLCCTHLHICLYVLMKKVFTNTSFQFTIIRFFKQS